MKTITIIVWFATAALLQPGALAQGSVLSVTKSPDKHALRICYEVAGHTNEQTLVLTNEIDDYFFCRFVGILASRSQYRTLKVTFIGRHHTLVGWTTQFILSKSARPSGTSWRASPARREMKSWSRHSIYAMNRK